MNFLSASCLVLFGSIAPGQAQTAAAPTRSRTDWVDLSRIESGAEIRTQTTGKRWIRGSFESATGDALFIHTGKGEQMLPRASVVSVSLKAKSRRLRHMLIGLGIGAGGGLAAGAAVDATHQCHANQWCFFNEPFGKEFFTPVGGIIGLLVGAAIPSHGWREIYRQ